VQFTKQRHNKAWKPLRSSGPSRAKPCTRTPKAESLWPQSSHSSNKAWQANSNDGSNNNNAQCYVEIVI